MYLGYVPKLLMRIRLHNKGKHLNALCLLGAEGGTRILEFYAFVMGQIYSQKIFKGEAFAPPLCHSKCGSHQAWGNCLLVWKTLKISMTFSFTL